MIGAAINSEDLDGKRVSLRLTLLLILITAFAVYEGAYIYFRFEKVEANQRLIQELHKQDMEHIKAQQEYERERVDRKFKRLEND